MHNIEIKIKNNRIWRHISLAGNWLLNICWRLSSGLKATFWYVFFVNSTRNPVLMKNGLQIIHGDDHFTDFAEWLSAHIPNQVIETGIKKMRGESASDSSSDISEYFSS